MKPVTAAEPPQVNVKVEMPQQPAANGAEAEPERPPTWFWDLLQSIPAEQWGKKISVIAWRLEPKVPGTPGAKGFLFEAFEPVNLMYFKQNYGGGKFRCVLLENSRFKTTHDFDIEGTPKYDLTRENPSAIHAAPAANGDRSAEVLQQFVGVLRDELKNAREANSATPAGNERVIEMLMSASEKAVEIVQKQAPQGTDQLTQLTQMATLLKGLMPQQQESGLLSLLTPLLKPLLERLMQPVDPLAQVTAFLGIFEKIDAIRGGGGGGGDSKPKDWRAMLAEGVVQKGPELIKEIRETLEVGRDAAVNRRAAAEANARTMEIARAIPSPTPGQPPIPAAPLPATSPSVMPGTEIRVVPIDSVPPAAAPPAAPPAAANMTEKESDVVAVFMKRKIVQMLRAGVDSDEIVNFIETVDPAVCDLILQNSPEMITTFLNGDPILKEATALPDWLDFLADAQDAIKEKRGVVAQTVPN